MPTVYKRKCDRNRRDARWMIAWTDETGERRTRKGYLDKLLSERLARRLEDEARARREGTIDVAAERMIEHASRAISGHVSDYERHLDAKGNTSAHTALAIARIKQAVENCAWQTIADIDAASLNSHIEALKGKDRGRATINHHLRAVKGFTRWLAANHRRPSDPLIGVRLLNTQTDRRRERRALDEDELARLIETADASDEVTIEKRYKRKVGKNRGKIRIGTRKLCIPNRGELYLLAASTGLRVNEIRSLTTRSFDLGADPPTVTLEAGYSKRRRRDVQPMRRDVAEVMRKLIERTAKGKHLWPNIPQEMGKVIAVDLGTAGIPVSDDAGRVVDFHALRHTFITRMARSGVTPKVAQALARHSTITLTMDRYAHVGLADVSRALEVLPAIPGVFVQRDVQNEVAVCEAAATGTDGPTPTSSEPGRCMKPTSTNAAPEALRFPSLEGTDGSEVDHERQRREQRAGANSGQSASSCANSTSAEGEDDRLDGKARNWPPGRELGYERQPTPTKTPLHSQGRLNEADGIRTRNHRIDSPGL